MGPTWPLPSSLSRTPFEKHHLGKRDSFLGFGLLGSNAFGLLRSVEAGGESQEKWARLSKNGPRLSILARAAQEPGPFLRGTGLGSVFQHILPDWAARPSPGLIASQDWIVDANAAPAKTQATPAEAYVVWGTAYVFSAASYALRTLRRTIQSVSSC